MHKDQFYIEGFRSKDEKVVNRLFKEIYDHYETRIVHFVETNSGNTTEGADIFQRCVIALYQKTINDPDFQLTSSIYTYLYSIARNLWFKELKKKKREPPLTNEMEQVLKSNDTSLMELMEEDFQSRKQLLFAEKFKTMKEECKKLLTAYFEEKTPEEIASIFSVTYGSFRVKKSRCVKRLTLSIQNDKRYLT